MDERMDDIETDLEPRQETVCWQELIWSAMEGLCPCEQKLEELIDRIEGTP